MLMSCVPNVSERRRPRVVDALALAIRSVERVTLLDNSADASHNRSVFTFAGEPDRLAQAVMALYERAIVEIDLRGHRGEHPRIGAVDVVPFVPLDDTPMAACVELARQVAQMVASRFLVPVSL